MFVMPVLGGCFFDPPRQDLSHEQFLEVKAMCGTNSLQFRRTKHVPLLTIDKNEAEARKECVWDFLEERWLGASMADSTEVPEGQTK
jgi:hypothetical protein